MNADAPVPCTANQVMVARLQAQGYVSNIPFLLRAKGPLCPATLRDALQLVVDRHAVLRSVLAETDDGLVQAPVRGVSVALPLTDVSAEADPLAAALAHIAADGAQAFGLSDPLRLRGGLFRLAAGDHLVGIIVDHLAADGVSLGIIAAEWRSFYQAIAAGTPFDVPLIAPQYRDFAAWQRAWLQSGEAEQQRRFWIDALAGIPSRAVSGGGAYAAERLAFELDPQTSQSLAALCVRLRVKPFAAVLALYALLLFAVTGERDLVIGTVRANRRRADTAAMVGHFANLIPLRVRIAEQQTLEMFVRDVASVCAAAYAHDALPFPEVAAALWRAARIPASRLAEFSINFVPFPDDGVGWGDGLRMAQIWGLISDRPQATSRVTLFIRQQRSAIGGTLVYDRRTLDPAWAASFPERFGAMIAQFAGGAVPTVGAMLAELG